ncbi:hypothetical protein BJV78DRAFT_1126057 [Lactifluus subvellereus]|nr:hypothetical protein BJV78DRAFT_1126057 [Lactifluus subvellereus]
MVALAYAVLFSFAVLAHAATQQTLGDTTGFKDTCGRIAAAISSASAVFYPPSEKYTEDIAHWAASSTMQSACSVEPGTPQDVGTILRILGETRTPFAVKGGGHTSNPGFSSTPGVHIAMTRFNTVTVNQTASTVAIGAGLLWDDVYAALDGTGLNVVGGRVRGVGVAGFILGGGYSWKTSQFGLTIDTVVSFELVLPDGTIQTVTSQNEDLWFGLRGGFNNFGIVTKFVLNAHPQGLVWGGFATFLAPFMEEVNKAIVNFHQQWDDKKAAILPTYNTIADLPSVELLMFYDGPEPPDGTFDDFFEILEITKGSMTFPELLNFFPAGNSVPRRGYFSTVPVLDYSPALLDAIVNETFFWGEKLTALDISTFVSYDVEPFDPGLFSHSTTPSAYPPDRSRPLLPTNLYFGWSNADLDTDIAAALRQSTDAVRAAAVADGQDVANAFLYGNYALFGTSVEAVYGANVPRLTAIRKNVDPTNVMGLAGGFKF